MIEFDPRADALYVHFNNRDIAAQVEMPDGVIVDVDKDGLAVGVDIMSPSTGWDVGQIVERFELDANDAAYLTRLALAWTA